ncbi:hypothetical protein DY000_02021074 [Brassica cretica]|uniref:Uncharacterized protein n=1 Tax=Brassica cretica TaxID=69181 RepID=A0ABQ7EHW6_BRACR|nr:hypothetical protein DY000_02021074 [Brassica cretica]
MDPCLLTLKSGNSVRSSADTKKERSRQRSLSVAKAKSLGGRSLNHPGSDIESNDLVNHIGGVFRYFIVDVVDHGSTPDVARCGRELGEKFLSHEQGLNRMNSERDRDIMSLYSVTSGYHNPHKWSKIFSVYKRRRKTVGRSSLQVHKFMEEGFTRLRVTHKSRWWQAASIRKRGFRAVFDLQSQGGCDSHKGFHGVLGLNLQGISVAGGVLIYVGISARWYSLVSMNGVAEGLKKIDSCGFVYVLLWESTIGFLLEWICENEELLVQGRVRLNRWQCQIEIDLGWKHRFFASKVFASCVKRRDLLAIAAVQSDVQGQVLIQIVTKEILRMRSLVSTGY